MGTVSTIGIGVDTSGLLNMETLQPANNPLPKAAPIAPILLARGLKSQSSPSTLLQAFI